MNEILRPPVVPGTMAAFTAGEINIPFSMNRSVSNNEIFGFALKIRTAQGQLIDTLILDLRDREEDKIEYISQGQVPFSLESLNIDLRTYDYDSAEDTDDKKKFIKLFNGDNPFLLSLFYKFQLAYCSIGDTGLLPGYYSTITVGKYTSKPSISIVGLEEAPKKNGALYSYTGVYSQSNDYNKANKEDYISQYFLDEDNYKKISSSRLINVPAIGYSKRITLGNIEMCYLIKRTVINDDSVPIIREDVYYAELLERDITEKLYSSSLVITDDEGTEYYNGGEVLHNTQTDETNKTAKETFSVEKELKKNKIYFLYFKTTTRNGLETSSESYRIVNKTNPITDFSGSIKATLNAENGYIDVDLLVSEDYNAETGHYAIFRHASNEPDIWRELYRFDLNNEIPTRHIWKDFCIEQGITYTYALRQYSYVNDETKIPGIYTERVESNSVKADFEYLFLFDGDKQLKIKYNPSVSSFKSDVLESKVDTIGGKYPLIFRNGIVNYKEFPISGLISYLSDEEGIFYNGLYKILKLERDKTESNINTENISEITTNLTQDNFTNERDFKLAVLDWLNNGQPKLFKSPAEGNYIVRLINTSMTPNDTLGRMLHTFSSTAYEVDENSYTNLLKYGIVNFDIIDRKQKNYSTYEIKDIKKINELKDQPMIRFTQNKGDKLMGFSLRADDKIIDRVLKNGYEVLTSVGGRYNFDISQKQLGWGTTDRRLPAGDFIDIYCKNLYNEIEQEIDWSESSLGDKAEFTEKNVTNFNCEITYETGKISYQVDFDALEYQVPLKEQVTGFKITDVPPETLVEVDGNSYMVGPTGTFNYDNTIKELSLKSRETLAGNIYLEYWGIHSSFTDLILDTNLIEYPSRQFFGGAMDNNIVNDIESVRETLLEMYNIKIRKKDKKDIVEYLFDTTDKRQLNHTDILKKLTEEKSTISLDNKFIYYSDLLQDGLGQTYYYYYDDIDDRYYAVTQERDYEEDKSSYIYADISYAYYYIDEDKKDENEKENNLKSNSPFCFCLGDEEANYELNLISSNEYLLNENEFKINKINLNFGVYMECSYLIRENVYKIEETDFSLAGIKANYEYKKERLIQAFETDSDVDKMIIEVNIQREIFNTTTANLLYEYCLKNNIELGRTPESKKLIEEENNNA